MMQGADENDDGKESAATALVAAVDSTTRLLETDGARRSLGAEPGRPVAEVSPAPEFRGHRKFRGESKTARLCPRVLELSTSWSPRPELPPERLRRETTALWRCEPNAVRPLARMRIEGTVVGSLFSVTLHLTSRVFVRFTKDTTYLTGNEGQIFRTVFSPLQS